MAKLAGRWDAPSITGDRVLEVDGRTFHVPQDAEVRAISAGKIKILHVKHNGRVAVLSGQGQFVESDDAAKRRATANRWDDTKTRSDPF